MFGAVADVVGKREISMLTEGTTVDGVMTRLVVDYPELQKLKLQFAVNQEFATGETVVPWFAEVAIFTAVSGG